MMFWTSAVYKDGLVFLLIAVICWQTMKWMRSRKNTPYYLLIIIPALAGLFLLRTYVPLLVIPPLIAWIIAEKSGIKPAWIFLGVYGVCALLVVTLKYISPALDAIRLVSVWQNAFLELPANSALPAAKLQPSLGGLIKNLPQSINFGLLRPLLWENKGLQYLPFAIELLAMQALFVFSLITAIRPTSRQAAFQLFCFCLAISACLFLGYTVHIIGALGEISQHILPLPVFCYFGFDKNKQKADNYKIGALLVL